MKNRKYLFYASQNYSFAILRPLQKLIREQGGEVKWYLNGNDINASYLLADESRLLTIEDVMSYKADATFVPGNSVPTFIPGLKIAVFHGFNVEKRSNSRGHFNIRGYFDLYCTQGPNTTETFIKLAQKHKHFSVKETGWPAIDTLHKNLPNKKNARPTVLFCSTFSPQLSCAEVVFNKIKQLSEHSEWQWLVQFHPKMALSTVEKYKAIQNENLTFVETDNVIPLLQKADIMLCDTSSIMSLFLLLNKPVVTFNNAKPKKHFVDISDV